jgi:O-antigen ligase
MHSVQRLDPSITLTGAFLLLAWLSAIFFQGLNIYGLLATKFFLVLGLVSGLWRLGNAAIQVPRNALLPSLFAFSLWLLLSLNWSLAPQISGLHLWIILSLPAAFLIYALADVSHRHWQILVVSMTGAACLLAINVIWLAHHGEARLSSVFLNPNLLSAMFNLIVLPVAAGFLYARQGERTLIWLGIALFTLVYAIGLIQSRGAILCLLAALLILVLVCRSLLDRKRLLLLTTLVAVALLIPTLEIHQSIASPISVVVSGERIDQGRLAIWGPAWELVKSSPWVGSGIGLFWLLYPQVRYATDTTAGHYAHNDYLQIWIEAGLPALVLLIVILLSTLFLYVRIMRHNESRQGRLEASGLFCGLLAVATHSLVTFNFYIVSILILCGICLGRLNQLSGTHHGKNLTLQLPRVLSTGVFRSLLVIAGLVTLGLISAEGLASHYQNQAALQQTAKHYLRANASLHRAQKFLRSDALLLDHAGLYSRVLQILPVSEKQKRHDLFTNSLRLLAEAERMNPLRAKLYLLRGQLYAEHPDLGGTPSTQLARRALLQAISLNPRNRHARFTLARLYLKDNDKPAALAVLDEGLRHYYPLSVDMLPYLQLYQQQQPGVDAAINGEQLASIIRRLLASRAAENLTISE